MWRICVPEIIWPLVVLDMLTFGVPPLRGQPQVYQVQLLGSGAVGRSQQEVLWLHIPMHIPIGQLAGFKEF